MRLGQRERAQHLAAGQGFQKFFFLIRISVT
jgi:hypothetical protein